MSNLSRLLLINRLCDEFESSFHPSQETDIDASQATTRATPSVVDFVRELRQASRKEPFPEALLDELAVELLVIELQSVPFPSIDAMKEKYPQMEEAVSAAERLLSVRSRSLTLKLPAASEHDAAIPQLPVEESLFRKLPSGQTSTGSESAAHPFGRYRLIEKLGAGGFGVVFRAWDPVMKRDVAIKIPRMSLMMDDSAQSRLEQEINALAKLNHPNIVTAYHAEEIDGYFCLISEFVAGGTLATWLAEKASPVSARDAANIALQICAALEHAHEFGVVHRDIKPSNILVVDQSEQHPVVKLADFGLAKIIEGGRASTSVSLAIGTLQYMSPEQLLRSETAGHVSDIYSVGVLLYQLLTGHPPFSESNETELFQRILERQPAALQKSKFRVPANLAAIVSQCLMKRPVQRYQNASDLKHDLEKFLDDKAVSVKPLSYAGKLAHWCRSKQRMREAGIYSLVLMVSISVWSALIPIPLSLNESLRQQFGVESVAGVLKDVIPLLVFVAFPAAVAAWWATNYQVKGVLLGLLLTSVNFVVMAANLFGLIELDFGGIYKNDQTRRLVFSLLTTLTLLEVALYAVAWYGCVMRKFDESRKQTESFRLPAKGGCIEVAK